MMNKIKGMIAITAFGLLILGLPAIASVQWNGGYGGNNGGNRGNGGIYGNGGYYGNNSRNIRSTVRNLKNQARNFERATDRADDRYDDRDDNRWGNIWGGRNNNGQRLERIEDLADDFAKAADRLEDKYGNGRNLNNSADAARRVLDIASQIDQVMNNSRGRRNGNLQNQWNNIQRSLDAIADVYGYNNRGNRRGGSWRNNFPF